MDNDLNAIEKQQLKHAVQLRQEQIAECKRNSKTFLLCWNRLKRLEADATSLGSMPKEIILKILEDNKYIKAIERFPQGQYTAQFINKPLNFSYS